MLAMVRGEKVLKKLISVTLKNKSIFVAGSGQKLFVSAKEMSFCYDVSWRTFWLAWDRGTINPVHLQAIDWYCRGQLLEKSHDCASMMDSGRLWMFDRLALFSKSSRCDCSVVFIPASSSSIQCPIHLPSDLVLL